MKKENNYKICFFTTKEGWGGNKSPELFKEVFKIATKKEVFKIAKNTIFNICENEAWADHPLKEERATPEIEQLLENEDYNNDLLTDFLENNENYDYNKIIHFNDDLYNPKIIMTRGDYSYYYDGTRTFFKIYKLKNKK